MRSWVARLLVLVVAIGLWNVATLADEKYKKILFNDDGRIDVHYVTGSSENYIYLAGPNHGLTVTYPLGGTAPSLSFTLSGIEVVAGQGKSFGPGTCIPDEHLTCSNPGGGPISCSCGGSSGWCDTDDEGPVEHTSLSRVAGCE